MRPLLLLLAALLAIAPAAHARRQVVTDPSLPRELPADGAVSVHWSDPAQFTELRLTHNRWAAERGDWVTDLARHPERRVVVVAPTQHLKLQWARAAGRLADSGKDSSEGKAMTAEIASLILAHPCGPASIAGY